MTEFKTPIKNKALDINDKITIPPSPFLNRLGYGTGVSVMQLVRSPRAGQIRSPWALKMLNKRVKPNKVYTDRIKAEADLLQRMSHPNIVGFRAFSKAKILYLGMEACDLSLGDMIEKRIEDDGEPFLPKQILKVAADISSALDYLHTKMQILHGDMKSYNILVNGDFMICKLCDFGVTLPLDENGVFDKRKAGKAVYFGTEAWSAPEVIHSGEISNKTDIWPLGLTLWEMMALMPPHMQTDDDSMEDSMQCLDDSVDSIGDYFSDRYGTRPSIPVNIPEKQSDSEYETYLPSDVMEHNTKSNRKPTLPVPGKRKSTKQNLTHPSKTSKSDIDIFGISRKHNNGRATANNETSSLPSYFVNRVANGSERRTTSTNGEYYVDCKVYKTEDARLTDSLELWKKALVRIKVQTDINSTQWRKLQEFIVSTDALFPEPPTYYEK